jgi:predicted nucleotide-binding protein
MNKSDLLKDLIKQTEELPDLDGLALDALKKYARMIVLNIFPDKGKGYSADIANIGFHSPYAGGSLDKEYWDKGKGKLLNLFRTLLMEVELFPEPREDSQEPLSKKELSKEIFIVHGTDEEMKLAVARVLDSLKLDPIILHNKPDKGRTIIEKISDYSDVGAAIVVLSPDDLGFPKDDNPENAKFRARQNVIFELGFFIGILGRERVIVLHKEKDNFEWPSDYSGVIYKPYKQDGNWPLKVAKELIEMGYMVKLEDLP